MAERVELADVIRNLRHELQRAMDEGDREWLRFEIREIEIEAQVAVERKAKGDAGVKFWVYSAVSGERSAQTLHKVRLKLGAVTGGGGAPSLLDDKLSTPPPPLE